MNSSHPRLKREAQTVEAMIRLYCHAQHHTAGELCPECAALQAYAQARLQKCIFQEKKPTCAKCPVHCYKPDMRQKIRTVMAFAGPRMLFSHPILAIRHLLDGAKKAPARPVHAKSS